MPSSLEIWVGLFGCFLAIRFTTKWLRRHLLPEQHWKRRRPRRRKAVDGEVTRYVQRLERQL